MRRPRRASMPFPAAAPIRSSLRMRQHVFTVGFGTAVAMWAVGYLCRLPIASDGGPVVPGPLLLAALVLLLVAGGLTIGRHASARPLRDGAMAGAVTGAVNLLILGSVFTREESRELASSLALWVPGSLLASALIGAIAARIQAGRPGPQWSAAAWRSGMALVLVVATLLVVVAGGVVTSAEAGLAVPDWPGSFGSNMFLYPLARMTGGIYYEHAHRLYGALVGLTSIATAVALWRRDVPRLLGTFAAAIVLMVIVQGLMGGFRVTEKSVGLAVAHGIFGQCVFAATCVLWAATTGTWRSATQPTGVPGAGADRSMLTTLVVILLAQLAFGALYRHLYTVEQKLPWPAHAHLTLAAVVAVVAGLAGLRCWARYGAVPTIRRHGAILLGLLGAQLLLGLAALVAVLMQEGEPGAAVGLLATAHQANGALLLAVAVLLAAWLRRLVAPAEAPQAA